MKKFNPFPYIFIFLATFLVLQWFQKGVEEDPVLRVGELGMKTAKNEYAIGKDIRVELQNNTEEPIEIGVTCFYSEEGDFLYAPFTVEKYSSEGFTEVPNLSQIDCSKGAPITIDPGKSTTVSLLDYSYLLFGEPGRYRLSTTVAFTKENEKTFQTPEFEISEPGVFTTVWRTFLYRPILNSLVAILIYMPGHSLGLAVIILTLILRTILLAPSQKAIKAQRQMQEVQPKIEELKKKYAGDQARLAQETMLVWKESKVHPLSSCLPILIQMPILIALFYVVNGGLSPDRTLLIYDFLPEFHLGDIDPNFLGFDLFKRSILIFPLAIGALQFFQMQLMTARAKKKGQTNLPKEMETANKMMKYMMPLMIAFFTAQLPAAVGLYWGTTTFYGIVQQVVVNRGGPKSESEEDKVQVRVIQNPHG